MKYRKKTAVKAIRYFGDIESFQEAEKFMGQKFEPEEAARLIFAGQLPIVTLEGTMIASEGDYIIKGVRGEFYPCKPDIFAEMYEAVEEE